MRDHHFPSPEALEKLVYLECERKEEKWARGYRVLGKRKRSWRGCSSAGILGHRQPHKIRHVTLRFEMYTRHSFYMFAKREQNLVRATQ